MAAIDVITWAGTGLVAGALVSAAQPGTRWRAWLLLMAFGMAAATGGGALGAALSDSYAGAFLGSACLAVLCTVSGGYLLQRRRVARYHR